MTPLEARNLWEKKDNKKYFACPVTKRNEFLLGKSLKTSRLVMSRHHSGHQAVATYQLGWGL